MNLLDIVLLVLLLGYASSGYWQGFVVGAASTIGLLSGGAAGILFAPRLLESTDDTLLIRLGGLIIVIVAAALGQVVGGFIGAQVRAYITWQPARALDAVGGAALSVMAALLVAWALGYAVSGARIPWLGNQVRSSTVLSAVDTAMPDDAAKALGSFDELIGSDRFPRFLEPFVPERIVDVPPATARVLRDADVRRAAESVVKVLGEAPRCNRGLEGSGFVYAPGRVMTNAHVVAGVSRAFIEVGGDRLPADVVVFDPTHDVAVLAVDGLSAEPLRFDRSGESKDTGAVLGFPQNGPFQAAPARIRSEQRLRSPDIYDEGTAPRAVFSIRSTVRPGNSGGPLVSPRGRVYGVVFAASVTDDSTGYVLTANQVAAAAGDGRANSEQVPTGACT
ncbi:MarP family serine protease [soil metagenome]